MEPLNDPAAPVLFYEHATASGEVLAHAELSVEATLNSLSLDMIDLLADALRGWATRDDVVAVLFTGAGDRAFCAGGDIQALYHAMVKNHEQGELVDDYAFQFFEREYRLDYQIHTFPKPTVAIGHGVVMGGGLGIFSGSDFRIVSERSRIAMPEVTIGLFPDAGQTWLLRNMPAHYATFLGVTGSHMNGADALEVGLGTHQVDGQSRAVVLERLCAADYSAGAEAAVAGALSDLPEANLPDAQVTAISGELNPQSGLETVVTTIRGMSGASEWVDRGIAAMDNGCPTTVGIVVEQLNRAKGMTLAETFQMEMVIGTHCAENQDFAEGVRALLIEKDNAPQWQFQDLESLPAAYVSAHFADPWNGAGNPLADLGE